MTRMKDSGIEWIWEIPEEWGVGKIKYYFDVQLGKMLQPSMSSTDDIEIEYVKAINVQWDSIDTHNLSKMWCNSNDVEKYEIKKGDLLVCEGGEVGRCGIVTNLETKSIIQNAVHRIRSKQNSNVNYLNYYIQHTTKSRWFDILCNKATIAHLTSEKLLNTIVVLPPRDEQTKIADFLDKKVAQLDKVKALLEEQIATLQDYRQSLIYETVTKGLDKTAPMKNSGVDWIGEIPEGWRVKRLKDAVSFQTGTTPPQSIGVNQDKTGIRWFKPGDFSDERVDLSNSENYIVDEVVRQYGLSTYPEKTILLVGIASIGKVGYSEQKSYSNQQITALKVKGNVVSKYLAYLMFSGGRYIKETALYTVVPIINNQYLSGIKVVIPTEDEQNLLINYLDKKLAHINQMIDIKQKQIDNIKQQRQTLIYDVVTGKRRV